MFKNIKSNWREIVALIVVNLILFLLLMALGTVKVSESGPLSAFISQATTLIGGVAKFSVTISLAWFGLAVTSPEGAQFLLSNRFDNAWEHCNDNQKLHLTLQVVAVLGIFAALCMTSS